MRAGDGRGGWGAAEEKYGEAKDDAEIQDIDGPARPH